jgi:hypothetical protein
MNRVLSLTAALSVLGLLSLAACTAGVADDGTTGDDQEVVKSEGKMCGGIAGLRCKAGLKCKLSGNHPDASGTCVRPNPGEEGALCGGIAGLQCNPGLECKFASSSSGPPPGAMGMPAPAPTHNGPPPGAVGMPMPDQSGTCEKKSSGPPPGTMGMPRPPQK